MSEDDTQPQADYTQDMLFTEGLPALDPKLGYRGIPAASAAGISYRQLDYWARTDLVRPSLVDAAGSGQSSTSPRGPEKSRRDRRASIPRHAEGAVTVVVTVHGVKRFRPAGPGAVRAGEAGSGPRPGAELGRPAGPAG